MNNELTHWGIKGQKWGVRRYQNKDGSLTAAGRERYGTIDNFEKALADKNKSQRQRNLESQYMSKGFDQKTAEDAARKRLKAEAFVAAAAVSAATGAFKGGFKGDIEAMKNGDFRSIVQKAIVAYTVYASIAPKKVEK